MQKSWQDGRISLAFSKDLDASSTYTISCDSIPGINLASIPSMTFKTFYYKGRGTEDIPFLVENAQQLDLVRCYLDKFFRQTEDINIASFNSWSPIGDDVNPFTGTYDGNTKKISNLRINTDQQIQYAGIFGYNAGTMKSITVDGFSVTGGNDSTPLDSEYAGVIIGYNTGDVTDCSLTDSSNNASIIFGISCVGGICAWSEGSIASCYVDRSNFQLERHTDDYSYVGGICGYCPSGVITNCRVASSTFKGQSDQQRVYVGGIAGRLVTGSLSSCEVSHSIVQAKCDAIYAFAGGIGGMNEGSVNSCRVASCTVQLLSASNRSNAGGICGNNRGSINFCRVDDSAIYGNMERDYCGGISPQCTGGDINSCQVFNINVQGYLSGGICGLSSSNNSITSCCVASSSVASVRDEGGIVATLQSGSSVTSCYVENSILESNGYAGGICGRIPNTGSLIKDCNVSNTNIKGGHSIGGICGAAFTGGIITSCQVTSSTFEGNLYVGGICGYINSASVTSSNVVNLIIQGNSNTGGISGRISGSGSVISTCYVANSDIKSETTYTGGVCGNVYNNSLLSDNYVYDSSVKGDSYVGGLFGVIQSSSNASCSYIVNSSVQGNTYTGSICGRIYNNAYLYDSFTDNGGALTGLGSVYNCYDSITNFNTFKDLVWSDGLAYDNENSVWKNYNIDENMWPPDLKALPRQ